MTAQTELRAMKECIESLNAGRLENILELDKAGRSVRRISLLCKIAANAFAGLITARAFYNLAQGDYAAAAAESAIAAATGITHYMAHRRRESDRQMLSSARDSTYRRYQEDQDFMKRRLIPIMGME